MKTRVCLKYFVNNCIIDLLQIHFYFASNLLQIRFRLASILVYWYINMKFFFVISVFIICLYFANDQVIFSCSTCCLVRPVRATWVCVSFNSNQVIFICSTCCLFGPVRVTWVCASFNSNQVIFSCSTCGLVGGSKYCSWWWLD